MMTSWTISIMTATPTNPRTIFWAVVKLELADWMFAAPMLLAITEGISSTTRSYRSRRRFRI